MIHGWELCKKSTGCKGCFKTYYCSDCGDEIQRTPDHSQVVFNLPLGEVLLEKRRMLKEMKMGLWKSNVIIHGWELCKRSTGCKGCFKTMLKGERRLKTVQPGYRFKIVNYYCSDCGDEIQRTPDHSQVSFKPLGEILESSKRRRMLRPE